MFMLLQLSPLLLPWPTSTQPHPYPSLSQSPYFCPSPWVMHKCSLATPFTIFHPVSPTTLAAVSLFHVAMLLLLFCSLVYCALQTPHLSQVMWYLSFFDWLISLNMLSRSIHAVAKGRSSFSFTATLYKCTTAFLSTHLLMGTHAVSNLAYCKQCCYKYKGAYIFFVLVFHDSQDILPEVKSLGQKGVPF